MEVSVTGSKFEPTKANGFPYGRPEDVEPSELQRIVEETIESLPMELRLYPDVYGWRVAAAVREHLLERNPELRETLR